MKEITKRCSEGNKTALLAETLSHLRSLRKELQENDWMYSDKTDINEKMKKEIIIMGGVVGGERNE